MTTIRCRSESSGASMVVLQHATEPFTALNVAISRSSILLRLDELVAEALMVSLGMIVLDVFTNCVLK